MKNIVQLREIKVYPYNPENRTLTGSCCVLKFHSALLMRTASTWRNRIATRRKKPNQCRQCGGDMKESILWIL